jgi:hypothetical protein
VHTHATNATARKRKRRKLIWRTSSTSLGATADLSTFNGQISGARRPTSVSPSLQCLTRRKIPRCTWSAPCFVYPAVVLTDIQHFGPVHRGPDSLLRHIHALCHGCNAQELPPVCMPLCQLQCPAHARLPVVRLLVVSSSPFYAPCLPRGTACGSEHRINISEALNTDRTVNSGTGKEKWAKKQAEKAKNEIAETADDLTRQAKVKVQDAVQEVKKTVS